MNTFNFRHRTILIASGALLLSGVAQAQIDEIIVTANKREQTLQDIPVSVTVTTGDTISKAAIQDIIDLQSVVPTLRVSQLQSSTNTSFAIRGFGNGSNNEGIEPSVGVFIDGVYRSRAGSSISDLPRLERVEVLSGPQSILFGKNASAGVISIITPKPSGETGGYIEASLGNMGYKNTKALFESAISEDLSFDVSGNMTQRDGYFTNVAGGAAMNERARWGVRGQVSWTPRDNTEVRIIADYDSIDEVCCGTSNLINGATGGVIFALGGALVPEQPFAYRIATDIDPFNEVENGGISAQIDVDYESFVLTSITSQRFSDTFEALDIDFTSAPLTQTSPNDLNVDTFTQEIRLTSTGDGNLDWMVGAFYFNETVDYTSEVLWGPQARNYFDFLVAGLGAPGALGAIEGGFGFPAGTFFANGTGAQDTFSQDDQASSLFGQFDWLLNEQLTLTAGFNYTEAKKEVTVSQVNTNVFASLPASLLGGLAALQSSLPPVVNLPNAIEDNTSDDSDTTYTLRLAYDVNDNVNIYGSYATGFKASSWNLSRDSGPNAADLAALQAAGLTTNAPNLSAGSRFADPEESEVYELGLKAVFESGSFNMAIFDQTIKGFQSSIFNGTGFELRNAGMQSTKGVEFDLVYYPVESLRLGFAGTLLDPLYDEFVGGGFEGADLSGTKPAGIHEVSLSLSALYDFRLGNNDAYARADYQYADEVIIVDNIPPAVAAIATREIGSLNMSAGMNTQSGLNLSIWARNVTNDEYMTSGFPTPAQAGSFNIYPNLPRTFGITARKSF
ncbi:MAG: TonB-dependent receptor [Oceanospirillaceae bacterium]|tara:strand:- start:143 stop:2509 length:2367 start_codon:yes stop_codon:yes gene_type:complete